MKIDKVVIWGHKLHTHTHSYIHAAFHKTFQHLGYETHWVDNNDKLNFNIDNSFIITEGTVCKNMPINNTCFYLLHNVDGSIVNKIDKSKRLILQVYTSDCINRDKPSIHKFHYYNEGIIYFPWATDLLPYEIDQNIQNLNDKSNKIVNFVGMMTPPWDHLQSILSKHKIQFNNYGGTFNKDSDKNKSFNENRKLIEESIIAPALQTKWQVEHSYIPCRIFKNISYGKMGITNNKNVNDLFDNKLIYETDMNKLVSNSLEFEKRKDKLEIVKSLMENVRDYHTYINRINYIKWYMKEFMNIEW